MKTKTTYFVLYKIKSNAYLGIRPLSWQTGKVGYIDINWNLNVSQDLLDLIGQNEITWYEGKTFGGTREIKYSQFNSFADCICFLYKHNVVVLNP